MAKGNKVGNNVNNETPTPNDTPINDANELLLQDGKPESPVNDEKNQDTTTPAEVETSEKLTAILADQDNLMELFSAEKDRSKKLELLNKINASQDAEKDERNAIKRAKADRELQAKRNERIALIDSMLAAYDAYNAYMREYQAIPEVEKEGEAGVMVKPGEAQSKLDNFYHEYQNIRETIQNELLARVGIKVATTSNGGSTSTEDNGERGAKTKAIVEMYIANRSKGMTDTENVKDIIKAGYNDGTVGAAVVTYRRKNGLEPIK